jgi:hypothetical protein
VPLKRALTELLELVNYFREVEQNGYILIAKRLGTENFENHLNTYKSTGLIL